MHVCLSVWLPVNLFIYLSVVPSLISVHDCCMIVRDSGFVAQNGYAGGTARGEHAIQGVPGGAEGMVCAPDPVQCIEIDKSDPYQVRAQVRHSYSAVYKLPLNHLKGFTMMQ